MRNRDAQRTNDEGRQRLANFLQNVGIALIGGSALFGIMMLGIMAITNRQLEWIIFSVSFPAFVAGGILMAISLRFDEEEKRLKEHFARFDRNRY